LLPCQIESNFVSCELVYDLIGYKSRLNKETLIKHE